MTDTLDGRLRDIAAALVADAPEVPSLRARGAAAPTVPRRTVLAAAAAVIGLGVGGLVLGRRNRGDELRSVPPGSGPGEMLPTRPLLPVVEAAWDGAPDGQPVVVFDPLADLPDDPSNWLVSQAYISRDSGGTLIDGYVVTVGRHYALRGRDDAPLDITVFDRPARLWDEGGADGNLGSIVVWGDDPYVEVRGLDPLRFLARVRADTFTATVGAADEPVGLAIGELPEGYAVRFEQVTLATPAGPTASISGSLDGGVRWSATTTFGNPLMWNWIGRSIQVVVVRETGAWLLSAGDMEAPPDTAELVLAVDDSSYAWLSYTRPEPGTHITDERVVELARGTRFVTPAEWAEHYGVEVTTVTAEDRAAINEYLLELLRQASPTSVPS